MSVVIVGGHDRMVCQYKKICKQFKCKAKVFTHMSADLNKQLGQPDLFVLFTNTVSHKMVKTALDEAKRSNAKVVRSHTSSGAALTEILTLISVRLRVRGGVLHSLPFLLQREIIPDGVMPNHTSDPEVR